MDLNDHGRLTRRGLLDYFLQAAKPRDEWLVGMELEKMGVSAETGDRIPYDGPGPSVRRLLELLRERRGGDPVYEGDHLIGIDGPWGAISLEPGGQVEWSSRPQSNVPDLARSLGEHLDLLRAISSEVGVEWFDEAVDPVHALERMPWMPKARYSIMRPFLGSRGRLAHRMMTQTASIQCAFDYSDPEDWRRKFRAAALMTPIATALFANSPRIDGADTGYRCYRHAIWRETDPARCGLPEKVFDPAFSMGDWLDWVLDVPTIFRHRARGLVPAGGVAFSRLMRHVGCDAIKPEDWESHLSTIFTEVRSYTYIEVRSADLQPDHLAAAVPAFWTGILYDDGSLDEALDLGSSFDAPDRWAETMEAAARFGTTGATGGERIRDLASRALSLSRDALRSGARCAGADRTAADLLETLAETKALSLSG